MTCFQCQKFGHATRTCFKNGKRGRNGNYKEGGDAHLAEEEIFDPNSREPEQPTQQW